MSPAEGLESRGVWQRPLLAHPQPEGRWTAHCPVASPTPSFHCWLLLGERSGPGPQLLQQSRVAGEGRGLTSLV